MSKYTRTKRDRSHTAIVNELRQRGYSCADLSSVGDDISDILVACSKWTGLVEIKSLDGQITASQLEFTSTWRGNVMFATNVDEIVSGKFLSDADKDKIAQIAIKVRATSKDENPRIAVSKFAKLMQVC